MPTRFDELKLNFSYTLQKKKSKRKSEEKKNMNIVENWKMQFVILLSDVKTRENNNLLLLVTFFQIKKNNQA